MNSILSQDETKGWTISPLLLEQAEIPWQEFPATFPAIWNMPMMCVMQTACYRIKFFVQSQTHLYYRCMMPCRGMNLNLCRLYERIKAMLHMNITVKYSRYLSEEYILLTSGSVTCTTIFISLTSSACIRAYCSCKHNRNKWAVVTTKSNSTNCFELTEYQTYP